MQVYDILKILDVTKSCLDKTKVLLSSSIYFSNAELAYLCSYYVSLHDLKMTIDDFIVHNTLSNDEKIPDKDFVTKVTKYIKLTAHFEAESSKFVSFSIH